MKDSNLIYRLLVTVSVLLIVASAVKILFFSDDRAVQPEYVDRPLTNVEMYGDRLNLGEVPTDSVVTQNVLIVNKGPEPLYVQFVDPDCNCTGYVLSPSDHAAVGDTLSLELNIDMRGKKAGRFMLNTIVGMNTEEHLHRIAIEGDVIK